jgi:hypothetical protein
MNTIGGAREDSGIMKLTTDSNASMLSLRLPIRNSERRGSKDIDITAPNDMSMFLSPPSSNE